MSHPTVAEIGVTPAEKRRRDLCVDLLERMLREATEGRGFETAFFIGTYPDNGHIRNAWTEGLSTFDILARLEHLKHELLADMRDSEKPGAPAR
jgi:hypothetical protein